MAVSFPSNPVNGDLHSEKGRTWIYDSTSSAWKSIINGTAIDSDGVAEGTSNLFYTDARVGNYLSSNSYATETYVNTEVANLVDSAPGTLDTLNELAAALGDDPNFATTITNSLATKASLTGTETLTNKTLGATTIAGALIPDTDITYDLGSATNRFRDLYLSGNSIQLGTRAITQDNIPDVNLSIAPEVLEIQVDAPAAVQDTAWLWTW
jgi:nitrogen fixation/metabolism regulation signal transduction histidine kinase